MVPSIKYLKWLQLVPEVSSCMPMPRLSAWSNSQFASQLPKPPVGKRTHSRSTGPAQSDMEEFISGTNTVPHLQQVSWNKSSILLGIFHYHPAIRVFPWLAQFRWFFSWRFWLWESIDSDPGQHPGSWRSPLWWEVLQGCSPSIWRNKRHTLHWLDWLACISQSLSLHIFPGNYIKLAQNLLVHLYAHFYIYMYININVCMYIYTYIYIHIYIYVYTYIHCIYTCISLTSHRHREHFCPVTSWKVCYWDLLRRAYCHIPHRQL